MTHSVKAQSIHILNRIRELKKKKFHLVLLLFEIVTFLSGPARVLAAIWECQMDV